MCGNNKNVCFTFICYYLDYLQVAVTVILDKRYKGIRLHPTTMGTRNKTTKHVDHITFNGEWNLYNNKTI